MGYKLKRIMMRPNGVEKQVYPALIPITTPGIYYNSDLGLISISGDGSTRYTIADKNLGATQVYNSGDTVSGANAGKYYQRGNNYGFIRNGYAPSMSSSQVNAGNYGPGNYYSSSTFITTNPRDSSDNQDLWGGATGTVEAMQGPCDTGFHIPSKDEWGIIYGIITTTFGLASNQTPLNNYLKMPNTGYYSGGSVYSLIAGFYRSSTYYYSAKRYSFEFNSSGIRPAGTEDQNRGCVIRPFKNQAVQPDDSRTVLYQPS